MNPKYATHYTLESRRVYVFNKTERCTAWEVIYRSRSQQNLIALQVKHQLMEPNEPVHRYFDLDRVEFRIVPHANLKYTNATTKRSGT